MEVGDTGIRQTANATLHIPCGGSPRKRRSRPLLTFGIVAVLAALLLVACGGAPAASTELGGPETPETGGAPDFPMKMVSILMINLLTQLTGWGIQFIMCPNYLASPPPGSPVLGPL